MRMHAATDDALMQRVREGDDDAFSEIVARYKHSLVNYLTHLVRSRERAEEIAQDAFVRLYRNAAQGKFLDEMGWAPQDLIDTTHIYHRLYDEKQPLYGLSYTDFESKADRVFEWAVFPLSDDGTRIRHALSIDDYTMVTPRGRKPF